LSSFEISETGIAGIAAPKRLVYCRRQLDWLSRHLSSLNIISFFRTEYKLEAGPCRPSKHDMRVKVAPTYQLILFLDPNVPILSLPEPC